MSRIEQHGDVTRFEMSSLAGRAMAYSSSMYLIRGALVDCGFHIARRHVEAVLQERKPRGVFVTHYHEDHAGNIERVAQLGLPIAASEETLSLVRAPAPIRLYRRITWGSTPPLRSTVTPFHATDLALVHAPGHSADHHIVWDNETGAVFSGDLYLGVKVRIAHPAEDPRVLATTLRRVAALGPTRMFDAHRGLVSNPVPLLQAKADWTEETIVAIERRIAAGAPDAAIVRSLFGGESLPGYLSGGDYARTNFVRAVRRSMSVT